MAETKIKGESDYVRFLEQWLQATKKETPPRKVSESGRLRVPTLKVSPFQIGYHEVEPTSEPSDVSLLQAYDPEMFRKREPTLSGDVSHACTQRFSGRILRVEGDRIIIGFEIEGETEEREFAREDLKAPDSLLRVGAPVLSTSTLEFLERRQPIPETVEAMNQRLQRKKAEWNRFSPDQFPFVPPIGRES